MDCNNISQPIKDLKNRARLVRYADTLEGCCHAVCDYSNLPYRNSAEDMIRAVVDAGKADNLRLGTVYLCMKTTGPMTDKEFIKKDALIKRYMNNNESFVMSNSVDGNVISYYVTTNLYVVARGFYKTHIEAEQHGYDHQWTDDLKYWCKPCAFHHRRHIIEIDCDDHILCNIYRQPGLCIVPGERYIAVSGTVEQWQEFIWRHQNGTEPERIITDRVSELVTWIPKK